MRTALPNAARDTVAPTLHKAQDTLTETVLPAVRDALAVVAERGSDLLDSDVPTEARRRGLAVVKAAKGEVVVAPARRWKFGLGMLAAGAAFGVAIMTVLKKLSAPVDSYSATPSGTDGGITSGTTTDATTGSLTGGGIDGVTPGAGGTTTGGASPASTPVEDIDLRSGAPTNV